MMNHENTCRHAKNKQTQVRRELIRLLFTHDVPTGKIYDNPTPEKSQSGEMELVL